MEFFMTYSWALVIILAVIGVLFYLGVMDPGNLRPNSCMFSSGFTCYDYRVQAGGNLSLDLGQSMGKDVLVTGFNCTAVANPAPSALPANVTIMSGAHVVMPSPLNCTKSDGTFTVSGDYYQGTMVVNYTEIDTQMTHTIKGSITFKVI